MPDYSQTKIYKIFSSQTVEVYIGSTTQKLCSRMTGHRSDFKKDINVSSAKIMKYNDAKIVLIENFPCNNCEEKLQREQYWMDLQEKKCNKIRAHTSVEQIKEKKKEYQKENSEKIKDYQKDYQKENKENLAEKKKEYYKNNYEVIAEKMKEYREYNKEQIKEQKKIHYQNNKEILAEKANIYRQVNKEKIKSHKSEQIQCDKCDKTSTRCHLSRHKRTIYCINFSNE